MVRGNIFFNRPPGQPRVYVSWRVSIANAVEPATGTVVLAVAGIIDTTHIQYRQSAVSWPTGFNGQTRPSETAGDDCLAPACLAADAERLEAIRPVSDSGDALTGHMESSTGS